MPRMQWMMRRGVVLVVVVCAAAALVTLLVLRGSEIMTLPLPPNPPQVESTHNGMMQDLFRIEARAARDGWTPDLARAAGDIWRQAGDPARAASYWEAARTETPDVRLLRDLSQAYIETENWVLAADRLSALLDALPADSTQRTWAAFQLGLIRAAYDPDSARELLLIASTDPAYAGIVAPIITALDLSREPTRIGIALFDAGMFPQAELAFSQSADALGYAYGGLARDLQGKDGAAWIETAVALAPDDPQVRFLEGLHWRLRFEYAQSLASMITASALDPNNPALFAELGVAYQLIGDLPTAERWLQFAVAQDARFQPLLDAFYAREANLMRDLGLVDEAALPFESTPEAAAEATDAPSPSGQ